MNEKEIAEIRRRFRTDKNSIGRIRGCCVNEKKEIISEFDQTFGLMSNSEAEELLSLLRKTLSGGLGRNLIDMQFSNTQVLEGGEHAMLAKMRDSSLGESEAIKSFFAKTAATVEFDGSYLILLANDKYDVFTYHSDGEKDGSSEVFSYFLCAICPVKTAKPFLEYSTGERRFRSTVRDSIVGSPFLGFMFPAFTGRKADIYSAMYYTKSLTDSQKAFTDAVFASELPRPAQEQTSAFSMLLNSGEKDECSLGLVQSVQGQIHDMLADHKANREEEPLTFTKSDVVALVRSAGISDKAAEKLETEFDTEFGENARICPANLVDTKKFVLNTPEVTIKVPPEKSDLIETKIIDGTKYILIRADGGVEVNGISISIGE